MDTILIIGAISALAVAVLAQIQKCKITDLECSDCLKLHRKVETDPLDLRT